MFDSFLFLSCFLNCLTVYFYGTTMCCPVVANLNQQHRSLVGMSETESTYLGETPGSFLFFENLIQCGRGKGPDHEHSPQQISTTVPTAGFQMPTW